MGTARPTWAMSLACSMRCAHHADAMRIPPFPSSSSRGEDKKGRGGLVVQDRGGRQRDAPKEATRGANATHGPVDTRVFPMPEHVLGWRGRQ